MPNQLTPVRAIRSGYRHTSGGHLLKLNKHRSQGRQGRGVMPVTFCAGQGCAFALEVEQ